MYILVMRDDHYFLVGPVTKDDIEVWSKWNVEEGGDDPRWQVISLENPTAAPQIYSVEAAKTAIKGA